MSVSRRRGDPVPIYDIFSKRQKYNRGEVHDVFVYDQLPNPLRVQIVHILKDTLGNVTPYGFGEPRAVYQAIIDILTREYGVFSLSDRHDPDKAVFDFFLSTTDVGKALDVIELAFSLAEANADTHYQARAGVSLKPADAIDELNTRFREHGVGYQYESGELIRVDSQLTHAEMVRPALELLRNPLFEGANTEYLKAFEHFRGGRNEEALNECLKALESTLKVICHRRNWDFEENHTAKHLLQIVFDRGLIPSYLQSEFAGLRSSLESGVPTVRNRQAGHGQGTAPREVPSYLVAYLLHLTAANILLLVRADESLQ